MKHRFTKIRLFSTLFSFKLTLASLRLYALSFALAVGCQLLAVSSFAQVSSPAFDPNCYFPRIGVPGEIDTIYGAQQGQFLGADMLNIGPTPDGSYGRISCNLEYHQQFAFPSIFKSWPSFNLHQLQVLGKFDIPPSVHFGHFRSKKYLDILFKDASTSSFPARIYWQDDNGNYDSTQYTELISSVAGKHYTDYSAMSEPYTSFISSDTVEDIISMVIVSNADADTGKPYLIYFKGGEALNSNGKYVASDSAIYMGPVSDRISLQGDFRGIGKNDLIVADIVNQTANYNNLFYYKNDPPFSMAGIVHALEYDTLFAQWQSPQSVHYLAPKPIVMSALAKQPGDSSEDLLASFLTDQTGEIRIFKGGKDFGSHRLTADSAAFIIHEPYYYDNKWSIGWGLGMHDCGNMTGTRNHVLYVGGSLDNGFYGYEFFYMLGDAISDKVAMFIGPIPNDGGATGNIDTIVADNDNLQDVILGEAGFGLDHGGEYNGSIYILHGSTKIPETTRSTVYAVPNQSGNISVFPNPRTDGKCTLDLSGIVQQDLQIDMWDLLGRKVYSEHINASFMQLSHPISINSFPSGTYILEVTGKNFSQRIHLSMLK